MKKYFNTGAIIFGVGAIVGGAISAGFIVPKLPMSLGGKA